eukprot:TRINITY_DN5807_c0_g1_i1.p1 TRINITY_DN5807_c0_g1~~TRINITY_DN5807_c0_g1_i1.p1  ORF type:complete len:879 (-),score=265.06 TRINITY_DN5807_c0_g1_i1:1058-3694(-)
MRGLYLALVLSALVVVSCTALAPHTTESDMLLQSEGPASNQQVLSLMALRAKWYKRYVTNVEVKQHMALFTPQQQKLLKERAITIIDRSLRTLPLVGITPALLEAGFLQVKDEINTELFAMALKFANQAKEREADAPVQTRRVRRAPRQHRRPHHTQLTPEDQKFLNSVTDLDISSEAELGADKEVVAPPSILQAAPKIQPHSDVFNAKQLEALDRLTTDARHNLVKLIHAIEKATLESTKKLKSMPAQARRLQVREGKLIHQASNKLKKEVLDTLHTVQRAKSFLKTETIEQKNKFLRTIIMQTEDHLNDIYVKFLAKARALAPQAPPPPPPALPTNEASVKVQKVKVEKGEEEVPSAAALLGGGDGDGNGNGNGNGDTTTAPATPAAGQTNGIVAPAATMPRKVPANSEETEKIVDAVVDRASHNVRRFVQKDVDHATNQVERHMEHYSKHVRRGLSAHNKVLLKSVVKKITKYASKKIDRIASDMVDAAALQLGSLSQEERAKIVKAVVKQAVAQFKKDVGKVTTTATAAEEHLRGKGDDYVKEFIMSLREKATTRIDEDFEKAENKGRDLIEKKHNALAEEDTSSEAAAGDEGADETSGETSGGDDDDDGDAGDSAPPASADDSAATATATATDSDSDSDGDGDGDQGEGDGDQGEGEGEGENATDDDASVTITQDLLLQTTSGMEASIAAQVAARARQGTPPTTRKQALNKAQRDAQWGVLRWASRHNMAGALVHAVRTVNSKVASFAEDQMKQAQKQSAVRRMAKHSIALEASHRLGNYTLGVHGVISDFLRHPSASLQAVPKRMDRLENDLRKGITLAAHDHTVHAVTSVLGDVVSQIRDQLERADAPMADNDFSKYAKDPTASVTIQRTS